MFDVDSLLERLPGGSDAAKNIVKTSSQILASLEKIKSSEGQSEVQKQLIDTATKQISAIVTFLEHLEADSIATLHTALSEQSAAFNSVNEKLSHELQQDISKTVSELEAKHKNVLEEQQKQLKAENQRELTEKVQKQAQEFHQTLKDELERQQKSLEAHWERQVKQRVDEERDGRLARLDELTLKLKYLERISLDASEGYQRNQRIHDLQATVRAIHLAIDRLRGTWSFRKELKVLQELAEEDGFIHHILEGLPRDIASDYAPAGELVNHFEDIKTPLLRSQFVEEDADLAGISLAMLASFFVLPKHGLVIGSDVAAVIARAEHYLSHHDVDQAAREINQLRGWPKRLAADWLAKARSHLELQQAIKTIDTHLTLQAIGKL